MTSVAARRSAPVEWTSRLAWPLRVAAVYLTSRVAALCVYLWAWTSGVPEKMSRGDVSFPHLLARAWDGRWYAEIAEQGYPAELPIDPSTGDVAENAWAFFPLFPSLARAVMTLTGAPWEIVGPALSMAFGLAAMLVLYVLVREAAPSLVAERPGLPLVAVAGACFFPSAGVFAMAYSDSLALLLLATSLFFVVRQRYLTAVPFVVALGMTRAIALPIAAVVIWQIVAAVRARGWSTLKPHVVAKASALVVVAGAAGFAWPLLTAVLVGRTDAYFATQEAWRTSDSISTAPFSGWIGPIETWVGWFGIAMFVVVVMATTFTPLVTALGPVLQSWGGAYAGYLVAASVLSPSTPRYFLLMLTFQIVLVAWARTGPRVLAALGVLGALQAVWIFAILSIPGWTP